MLDLERCKLERNDYIDALKAILAFFVVCIHNRFPGAWGEYFTVITRIAVPCFFMISGYFYNVIEEHGRQKRNIKKIFDLLLVSNIIFFIWDLVEVVLINGGSITFWLSETFTFHALLKFVLLNESPVGGHLWYLGAILYVLIIVYFLDKFKLDRRWTYGLIPVLLLADIVFGKYSIVLLGREIPIVFVRNFLFVGLPYFLLGELICWESKANKFHRWYTENVCIFLIFAFSMTSMVEKVLLEYLNLSSAREHYISTTFLSMIVFLFVLLKQKKCTHGLKNDKGISFLVTVGRKCSTYIYILHPIFITILTAIMKKLGWYDAYSYFAPFVVYLSTLCFVYFLKKILGYIT